MITYYDHLLAEIVATCADIPNPAKGRMEFNPRAVGPFKEGYEAVYVCDLGYRLEGGDEVRTCEMDGFSPVGVWSGVAPYCAGKLSQIAVYLRSVSSLCSAVFT